MKLKKSIEVISLYSNLFRCKTNSIPEVQMYIAYEYMSSEYKVQNKEHILNFKCMEI
jgi:hypothetical protein